MIIVKVAWRNIWRNKTRSILILVSLVIGVSFSVFFEGMMRALMLQRVTKSIENDISHIQIHNKNFLEEDDISYSIENINTIEFFLENSPDISTYSSRIKISGIISSTDSSSGVVAYGIDAKQESQLTGIKNMLILGNYLDNQGVIPILVGKKLSENLNVKLNSRVVLGVVKADGSVAYGAFKVYGIFNNQELFDATHVFIKQSDMLDLLETTREESISEIALKTNTSYSNENIQIIQQKLQDELSSYDSDIIVRSWDVISPLLKTNFDFSNLMGIIFAWVILIGVIFGILNTMMISVMERTKEIGMLMSIGMTSLNVFKMIMLESIFLSLTGGLIGIVIGWILIIISANGINLEPIASGMTAVGYDYIIYPELSFNFLINIAFTVIVMAILAAILPAKRAINFSPAEAMRL